MKKRQKTKDRRQRKLSDVATGDEYLNEYEEIFLESPTRGPHSVDDYFREALGLDYFTESRLKKSRNSFLKEAQKEIPSGDLERIEDGIADYAHSSSKLTDKLLLLKISILNAFSDLEDEFLEHASNKMHSERHRAKLDAEIKAKNKSVPVTTSRSIKLYKQISKDHCLSVLKEYVDLLLKEDPTEIIKEVDEIAIHRGFNNDFYYKKGNKDSDFLSMYTGCGEGCNYLEPNILNSYSLCHVLAERFMVNGESQRRVMVMSSFACIENSLFSSFITNDSFRKNQFEFLVIPNSNLLQIIEQQNDEDLASFLIS